MMRDTKGWLPQFSLRTLFLFIALSSMALAAIVSANRYVVVAAQLVSAGTLPIAILLAIYSRGSRRAFWTGFSVFGVWSYLFLFTELGAGHLVWNPLRSAFEKFAGNAIVELHRDGIEPKAKELISSGTHNGKPLSAQEIQNRITRDLPGYKQGVINNMIDAAVETAKYCIHIALATFGGFLACWPYQLRERRSHSRSGDTLQPTA